MRPLSLPRCATVATLALAALPAAAQAADQAGIGSLKANPRAGYATWRAGSKQVVRTDAGATRRYSVPTDCDPVTAAAGTRVIAFVCDGELGRLNLKSGTFTRTPVDLPGDTKLLNLVAVGARWVQVLSPGPQGTFLGLVGLGSGTVIDLSEDPFGPRKALDLDSRSGARPLCAGTRRKVSTLSGIGERYRDLTYLGRGVLFGKTFFDCGTRETRPVPSGALMNADTLVLPRNRYANYLIENLRTGKRTKVTGSRSSRPKLSRGRLWLQDGKTGAVTSIQLA